MAKKRNTYLQSSSFRALIAGALISLLGGSVALWYHWKTPAKSIVPKRTAVCMNIFAHGSFGTILGLLSAFNVMKDDVDNTHYKTMTSHMRHDHFFYQMQPMLAPGLYRVTPTFDSSSYTDKKYAIFPVTAAYQEIMDEVAPQKEKQLYYAFGWSGLISQGRRRKEAIRLYNMLIEEYENLVEQGFEPRIRIIAHSHGGNVLLNLGGIHEVLCHGVENAITAENHPEADQREALIAIQQSIKNLKKKDDVLELPHQKKWDYTPQLAPFIIDDVIMLGTPIQSETQQFCFSPFLKNVYNIYSDDDMVQGMDWVSTKRSASEKRLTCTPLNTENKVIQMKLTLNQITAPSTKETESANTQNGFLGMLFGMGSKSKKEHKDPAHKELWFMGWSGQVKAGAAQEHIKPYPFAIFVPLLKELAHKSGHQDLDVKMNFGKEGATFEAHKHETPEAIEQITLKKETLDSLLHNVASWHPRDVSRSNEMNILHKYSQMLS